MTDMTALRRLAGIESHRDSWTPTQDRSLAEEQTTGPSAEDVKSSMASIKAPKGTGWSGGKRMDKLLKDLWIQRNSKGRAVIFAESCVGPDTTEKLVKARLESDFGKNLFSVEGGDYSVDVQLLYDDQKTG